MFREFERCNFSHAGTALTYYTSVTDSDTAGPIVILVQGSNPVPLFMESEGQFVPTSGQDIVYKAIGQRATLLLVEKPFILDCRPITSVDESDDPHAPDFDCPDDFHRHNNLQTWCANIWACVENFRASRRADPDSINLIGLSEGAVTAAALAASHAEIGKVVYISGFGSQLWADRLKCISMQSELDKLEDAISGLTDVAQDPDSIERFFDGQTHLYWSTFGRSNPAENLVRSEADLYLAFGSEDEELGPFSALDIVARRLTAQRSCIVRCVAGGDHMLATAASPGSQNLKDTIEESINWMLD